MVAGRKIKWREVNAGFADGGMSFSQIRVEGERSPCGRFSFAAAFIGPNKSSYGETDIGLSQCGVREGITRLLLDCLFEVIYSRKKILAGSALEVVPSQQVVLVSLDLFGIAPRERMSLAARQLE